MRTFLLKNYIILSSKFLLLRYFILVSEWSAEEFEELIYKVEPWCSISYQTSSFPIFSWKCQFFYLQTFKDVLSVDLAMASNLDSSASRRRVNRGFAFVRFSSHGVSLYSLFCARKFIFSFNCIMQCIPLRKSWPDNFLLPFMTWYILKMLLCLNFELFFSQL
jgi:hypothetical protein